MRNFKKVSKEEYDLFVKNYPSKLEWNVFGSCEPPIGTMNDFNLGNWPNSVVAKVTLNHLFNKEEKDTYYVLSEQKRESVIQTSEQAV